MAHQEMWNSTFSKKRSSSELIQALGSKLLCKQLKFYSFTFAWSSYFVLVIPNFLPWFPLFICFVCSFYCDFDFFLIFVCVSNIVLADFSWKLISIPKIYWICTTIGDSPITNHHLRAILQKYGVCDEVTTTAWFRAGLKLPSKINSSFWTRVTHWVGMWQVRQRLKMARFNLVSFSPSTRGLRPRLRPCLHRSSRKLEWNWSWRGSNIWS